MAEVEPEGSYRIAYDCERRKVGCVLIQAVLGCTVPNELFYEHFGLNDWLTEMTPGMQVYAVTEAQLPILAAKTDSDR